ncbi:MAG: CehA/McbA family metallohydrolase [Planctomycetaceae bacterium]|nr:CehA/McbA family metallohydrolase [Planctomycetaceae bacterium]
MKRLAICLAALVLYSFGLRSEAADVPVNIVEGQPLAANVNRLLNALDFLGSPLSAEVAASLKKPMEERDSAAMQKILDREVLCVVHLNPEYRVKVSRGPDEATLVQNGYRPCLVKILNESTLTERLRISSPQSGALYAGVSQGSLTRQQQTELAKNENTTGTRDRIFEVEMFQSPPMTERLSGLEVEYAIALIYCLDAGKREATLTFDVGQGTQDIGFRGELPVLFDVRPAVPVQLSIHDFDGEPTTAKLVIRDPQGQVYPPQPKRLAPDFFFQEQIYRHHGEVIDLAPGTYTVESSRGPEYHVRTQKLTVPEKGPTTLDIQLERWINPLEYGFYCGDHHIHGAGCAHYQVPTQGVTPEDMFRQVKGEGLNVGCVLTWGPCYDFQRQYFSAQANLISEAETVLKYDLEISGFGSAALGHVCLLNLSDQTYPGSQGTKELGWPSWTLPALKWAKEQGGVTGYPHSDMRDDPKGAAEWIVGCYDADGNGSLSREEYRSALLPEEAASIDTDEDGLLSPAELTTSAERACQRLPNLVLPSMRGSGAMEIFVTTPAGVCDFISAMDTARIGEWNTWYHIMNCGFPLKLSGETDFPCMSSRRVGKGRVYVQMGDEPFNRLIFSDWAERLGAGQSYVSDGFAHALQFEVNGVTPGTEDIALDQPGTVKVDFEVAFAPQVPKAVFHGTLESLDGPREVGDSRILHAPRNDEWVEGGTKQVELVVNGEVVRTFEVESGTPVARSVEIPIERSSWIALRQFPQLHTNPVRVMVADRPIRVSRQSAEWCAQSVELLWKNRSRFIREGERPAARSAYDEAIRIYRERANEVVQ